MALRRQGHDLCGATHDHDPHADAIDPPIEIHEPIEEPSDLDNFDIPSTDEDESRWDVFIPDDDERDPLPNHGDFWESRELGARSDEPD